MAHVVFREWMKFCQDKWKHTSPQRMWMYIFVLINTFITKQKVLDHVDFLLDIVDRIEFLSGCDDL